MKIGTGWLGWTEQETLNTSMNVILDAYEARIEMLCFMAGKPAPKKLKPRAPATIQTILSWFGKNK